MQDPTSYIQANADGSLCDARRPAISPLDRGFLYGDAIYEVWRSYHGVLFGWREHWSRLLQTAEGLSLSVPFDADEAFDQIRRTVAAWRAATQLESGDVYVRLQISRGGGPIGLDPELADQPRYTILVKQLPSLSRSAVERGLALHLTRKWARNSMQALPPTLKTGNYLNNILGLAEARRRGADDVLFLNAQGRLTEASTRNVWLVLADRVVTPPVADGLLAGVTRRILLERIQQCAGLPLVAEPIVPEAIAGAKECFLSSTTQDVQAVAKVDDCCFAVGADTATARLKKAFADYVAAYARENAQLRLS